VDRLAQILWLARRIPTIWILPRVLVLHVAHELVNRSSGARLVAFLRLRMRYESNQVFEVYHLLYDARSWTFSRFEIWRYERISRQPSRFTSWEDSGHSPDF